MDELVEAGIKVVSNQVQVSKDNLNAEIWRLLTLFVVLLDRPSPNIQDGSKL